MLPGLYAQQEARTQSRLWRVQVGVADSHLVCSFSVEPSQGFEKFEASIQLGKFTIARPSVPISSQSGICSGW